MESKSLAMFQKSMFLLVKIIMIDKIIIKRRIINMDLIDGGLS